MLVVAPHPQATFIEADVRGLAERFPVERIAYSESRSKPAFLWTLRRRLARRDVGAVLLWFLAPAYSLETMALAKRYRLPVVVAAGGLEVDYVPELRLGGLKWPHNRLRQRLGLRIADLVLAPSSFLAGRIRRLQEPRRLETVYNAVDLDRFTPAGEKEQLAMSVCFEISGKNARLKGLPTLLGAAAQLPAVEFVVVGRPGRDNTLAHLRAHAPPNVSFTGRWIPESELVQLYRRAGVYLQLSAHEAFGVAVAESMACGCVPVVSEQQALREVVGEVGFYCAYGDSEAAAEAIRSALEADEGRGLRARARVASRFSLDQRIDRLAELLEPLLD